MRAKVMLWIASAALILSAFVLRAVIPENWIIPGGRPVGSYWYYMDIAMFRLMLGAGILAGLIAAANAIFPHTSLKSYR
jgi:hypothetical protein